MRASIVAGLSRVSICDIRSREHPEGTLSWTHPGNRSPYCAKFFLCFTLNFFYMLRFNLILRLKFIFFHFGVW